MKPEPRVKVYGVSNNPAKLNDVYSQIRDVVFMEEDVLILTSYWFLNPLWSFIKMLFEPKSWVRQELREDRFVDSTIEDLVVASRVSYERRTDPETQIVSYVPMPAFAIALRNHDVSYAMFVAELQEKLDLGFFSVQSHEDDNGV